MCRWRSVDASPRKIGFAFSKHADPMRHASPSLARSPRSRASNHASGSTHAGVRAVDVTTTDRRNRVNPRDSCGNREWRRYINDADRECACHVHRRMHPEVLERHSSPMTVTMMTVTIEAGATRARQEQEQQQEDRRQKKEDSRSDETSRHRPRRRRRHRSGSQSSGDGDPGMRRSADAGRAGRKAGRRPRATSRRGRHGVPGRSTARRIETRIAWPECPARIPPGASVPTDRAPPIRERERVSCPRAWCGKSIEPVARGRNQGASIRREPTAPRIATERGWMDPSVSRGTDRSDAIGRRSLGKPESTETEWQRERPGRPRRGRRGHGAVADPAPEDRRDPERDRPPTHDGTAWR